MCETVISYISEVGNLYSNTERREVKAPGNVVYQLNLLMRTKCLCKSWRLWNECLTRQSTVITTTVSNEYVGLMLCIENQFIWEKNMDKRDFWWVREMSCHDVTTHLTHSSDVREPTNMPTNIHNVGGLACILGPTNSYNHISWVQIEPKQQSITFTTFFF